MDLTLQALDLAWEVMDDLFEEAMETPDDEIVTIPAGKLKKLMRQHAALTAYMVNDVDAIKRYLIQEKLI